MNAGRKFLPPGRTIRLESIVFCLLLFWMIGECTGFFRRIQDAEEQWNFTGNVEISLYEEWPERNALLSGVFGAIPYIILLCVIIFICNYCYYYRESRSIYLMKRLPSRYTLVKQCVTIPLLFLLISILVAAILLGVYLTAYRNACPHCILQERLEKPIDFWRMLR